MTDGENVVIKHVPVAAVLSPCVGICRIDRDRTCTGCGRTLNEIAEWSQASDDRKREILARIDAAP